MLSIGVSGFGSWRDAARLCLAKNVSPQEVVWQETPDNGLNDLASKSQLPEPARYFRVPQPFMELARLASCHRDRRKWELLYRTLWRLTHGERDLLEFRIDDDVYRLTQMAEAVRQDAQRMKSLVRFQQIESSDGEHYVAWFRPEHHAVRLVAPFFAKRFRIMKWAILTPDESVYWDGDSLRFGPGVATVSPLASEQLGDLWRDYYRSVIQPGPSELRGLAPTRHWATLPETRLSNDLLPEGPRRSDAMPRSSDGSRRSAADFLPEKSGLKSLATAAAHCEGCDLYKQATQTVFGQGPAHARVLFVGEQPGDEEDITGLPFVGPAGRVFNECLAEAGLDRNEVYVTNAVKHFKHTVRGKRRIHAKPTRSEVLACRPWLESEIFTIEPAVLVCLGATAAQSLLGADFRITKQRGQVMETEWAPRTLATWHPSSLLRIPDPDDRAARRQEFIADLHQVVQQLAEV